MADLEESDDLEVCDCKQPRWLGRGFAHVDRAQADGADHFTQPAPTATTPAD